MFPLLPEPTPAPLHVSSETNGFDKHTLEGLRVLLVDDEPEARQVISTVIKRMGAEVKACESAGEALATLVEWRPDVLMSDIGMPGEDGYSLIGKVRSLPRDQGGATPAAALTAYARDDDRKRALDAGYQLHIAKPVSSTQLVMLIARLVGRTV